MVAFVNLTDHHSGLTQVHLSPMHIALTEHPVKRLAWADACERFAIASVFICIVVCGCSQSSNPLPYGVTSNDPPVIVAAARGDSRQVRDMLSENGKVLLSRSDAGVSLLDLALFHGDAELAKRLIDLGFPPDGISPTGPPPLMSALHVSKGKPYSVFQYLLDKGANPNVIHSDSGMWVLELAIRWQKLEPVRMLKESGADFSVTNSGGKSMLEIAEEEVETLEDPNYRHPGDKPVDRAQQLQRAKQILGLVSTTASH